MKKTQKSFTVFSVILMVFFFLSVSTFAQSTIFTSQVPSGVSDDNDYELGVKFVSSHDAIITAIRYYKPVGESGVHIGRIWNESGTQLTEIEFIGETSSGWQTATLNLPLNITANTIYVVSVNSNVEYVYTTEELATSVTNVFLSTVSDGNNGVFNETPGSFPNMSFNNANYYRDIVAEVAFPNSPVLVSPADLSINISIEPELIWQAVDNADSYTLQVSDDNSFSNLIINESGYNSTSFLLSDLDNNTQYFWRVSAENFAGTSSFSTASFTTIEEKTPILSWPIGGATVYVHPPLLSWYLNSSGFGLKYDLIYSKNPGLTSPTIISDINTTSYSLNGLIPGTLYYWQVRSKTGDGAIISYSNIESFFTFGVALEPVASWPSGNATVYTYSPSLYWYLNDASFGLTYEVEIREGGFGMLTGIPTHTDITGFSLSTSGLLGNQEYSWQVRSKSGSNYSDWSTPVSFNTIGGINEPIVPIPSWPVDNADVYVSSPSLNWYLNTDGTGLTYEVEFVEGGQGMLTGTATHLNITSFSVLLSGLVGGNTYSWSVRSKLGLVYSDWSSPESFTIFSYVNNPVKPILSWPVGGATVYSTSTFLNWYLEAPNTNLTYEIEYSTGILSGVPTHTNITSTSFELLGLTEGATYNWSVRSTDGVTYSDWSDVETFIVSSSYGVAVVPNPSWPIGGATVYTEDPTLYWFLNSSSIGLTYDLKYSINSDMSASTFIENIASTNYTLTGLDQGTEYYWQVRSYDGNVYSAYSDIKSFVVYAEYVPAVPKLGSPNNGVIINSTSPLLSWYLPTQSNVSSYKLEYSTNQDFTNSVVTNVTNSSSLINGLYPDVTYYWRVRAVNVDGEFSNYSNKGKFKTNGITSLEELTEIPNNFELNQNYPNPFNPVTQISFSIPKNEFVNLTVYNLIGEKVAELVNAEINAGNYTVSFEANNLTSGVYFYRISTPSFNLTKKMLLMK